ncbi:hypothetical protein [Cytophaga sp. FL35]|uniref:hypothetical protein n=1 Tax=Cytophaga sp. FL35 TaxID=1904456 RepID=UPI001653D2D4|nr:hypothetical protein [Cytophaga sp. FL35]MBC6998260.1 hypothetical protein [Cytophaga sp. FL35]
MKTLKTFLFTTSTMSLLMGCVNLGHVTNFSKNSIEALQTYGNLSQSFTTICTQDCELKHISNFNVYKTDCECEGNVKADSITTAIYTATVEYLHGLMAVSDKTITKFQTAELTNALATGNYGPIKLNAEDVTSYSKLSSLILKAYSGIRSRKKIKAYVTEGHEPFQHLLHFLEFNLSQNLNGKLEVQKNGIQNFYFDLVQDTNLSSYERTKFAEDYFEKKATIEKYQNELRLFGDLINEVKEGHSLLLKNLDQLTEDEVKGSLGKTAQKLALGARIISQFN